MSAPSAFVLSETARGSQESTLLYLTRSEAPWGDCEAAALTDSAADQALGRLMQAAGGQWWHRSANSLCALFPQHQAALRSAWRLPRLLGATPSSSWCISLDGVKEGDDGPTLTRLHGLAQLSPDGRPVCSHRLRDRLQEPLEAQAEDLGLCHLKHLHLPVRAYRLSAPPKAAPWMPVGALPGLALLPPMALSDSPQHRGFGALLVDRLAHQLGRSHHLRLISPLSSRGLSGRRQARGEAGRWLAADHVLQGRYRVVGEQGQGTLELTLSLYAQSASAIVWEQVFRAQVGDVLASDSELVHAVSTGVHHAVLQARIDWARQQALRSLGDYDLMLTGVGLMHHSAPDDFDLGRQALLALLERSPDMGQAHAWLAKWHVLRVTRGLSSGSQDETAQAQTHAQRAQAAPDALGLARAMQGFVNLHLQRDLPGALAALQQTTQTHPNEPLAWLFRGVAESFADQGQAAMQASRRALDLSPLDPLLYYFESLAASSAIVSGDFAQAQRWCEQSLRRNLMHLSTHRAYITALDLQGQHAAARQAAAQLLRLAPGYCVAQFVRSGSSARTRLGLCVREALARAGLPLGD